MDAGGHGRLCQPGVQVEGQTGKHGVHLPQDPGGGLRIADVDRPDGKGQIGAVRGLIAGDHLEPGFVQQFRGQRPHFPQPEDRDFLHDILSVAACGGCACRED